MPRFVPRERKHKKLARAKDVPSANSNAEEIIPESQSEREARRNALKEELRASQPESKRSSKKRKRLDKYIDTKLKKDENAELLKKLEKQHVDTSLLQSSRKLGQGRESQRERMTRALKERDAGIGHGEGVLFQQRAEAESADGSATDDGGRDEESDGEQERDGGGVPLAVEKKGEAISTSFGSGLKRPLEVDESGRPVIQKRKRRKKNKAKHSDIDHETDDEMEDGDVYANGQLPDDDSDKDEAGEEWNGFSTASEPEDEGEDQDDEDSEISDDVDDSASISSSHSSSISASQDERPARMSAFKAWATSQRNAALDFTPSADTASQSVATTAANDAAKANFKPRQLSPEPLLGTIPTSQSQPSLSKPAYAITIPRSEEIQSTRLELPVVQEEQKIIEAIRMNPVAVVCGATGSGKTTQVPQMLLENGYASSIPRSKSDSEKSPTPQSTGMIGITQPRRVAATSVAARVSHELGSEYSKSAAHQVRYDTSVGRNTAIKFMTDGILLREIQQDFILSKYSVIVLDEAHERSVNTDLLIGLLSRIVSLRVELAREQPDSHYPLKLVIMSATLSHGVDSFLQNDRLWSKLGGPPPVVEAEGRQYPVTVHFARRTRRDYLSEVVEKVARGHRKLPPGGMLVFLTGQQEIQTVAKNLRERIGGASNVPAIKTNGDMDDYEDGFGTSSKTNDYLEGVDEGHTSDEDSEAEIKLDDEDAEFTIDDEDSGIRPSSTGTKGPLKPHILPLYAALPAAQQLKVFQPAPSESHRPIILATNVAETSLTIPGIRYVFDSGRVKEKRYDTTTGVQTFEVDWISKASAEQRQGRAGRTVPGHVWRLYSSAVYEEFFAKETVPEILRTPLESTILQLKAMEIENVVNFPFPTPPERNMLEKAERLLRNLGAIDATSSGGVSDVGRDIMKYPVSPRYGKILLLAQRNGIASHAVALVAGLAVGDLFIPEVQSAQIDLAGDRSEDDESDTEAKMRSQAENVARTAAEQRHQAFTRAQATLSRWDDHSDAVKLLTAVAAHAEASRNNAASTFCKDFWLREKGMQEVQLLRHQLHNIVTMQQDNATAKSFEHKISLPTDKERAMLNQIVAAGFIDHIAIRADMLKDGIGFGRKPKRAIEVPYRTLFSSTDLDVSDSTITPEEKEIQRSVFVHPSSVLARLSVKEMPQYVIYSHLSRTAPSNVDASKAGTKKTRMHPLTATGPKALAVLAEGTPLLQMGKPVGKIEEMGRGDDGKQRRQCWVNVRLKAPVASGAEWPLGAWKVVQRRGRRDWEVERVVAR